MNHSTPLCRIVRTLPSVSGPRVEQVFAEDFDEFFEVFPDDVMPQTFNRRQSHRSAVSMPLLPVVPKNFADHSCQSFG